MLEYAEGKQVLFITTKNLDYIRNSQEIELLQKKAAKLDVIGSKASGYTKRLWYVYRKLLTCNMKKYDLVFVGFAPQLIVPIWRKLRRKELAIDFFISLYDTMVCDRKKIAENSLAAKIMKRIDRKTLRNADHIICDTKSHGEYFAEELGADKNKLEVLYLQADQTIYYPRKVQKSGEDFSVLYFGSILPLQGVDTILAAIDRLKEEKHIRFYVIGPIPDTVKKPEFDNITYISWLSQEKLAEQIAQSDLCLAGHFNGKIGKARRTIPGKAYIYEAMEKLMILGDGPANHERYQEDGKRFFYVPMSDAEALADKILEIKELKEAAEYKSNEER